MLCISIVIFGINQSQQGEDLKKAKAAIEKGFEGQCGIYDVLRGLPHISTASTKASVEGARLYNEHKCVAVLKEVKK